MRAGVAEGTITPALGTHLSGYRTRQPANIIHDDLRCGGLVVEDGNTRIGLVTCDLVGLPVGVVQAWRPYLAARSGIPATNILINCSHTHAGPCTGMLDETFGERERAYREQLRHALAGVLEIAAARLTPVQLTLATGRLRTQRNRRDRLGGGPGPIDDRVGVLRVDALPPDASSGVAETPPLATVVHYASHPVALREQNLGFSADYVGSVRDTMRRALGAPCLFLQGACGDLVPELPMVTMDGPNGPVSRVTPDVDAQLSAAKDIGLAIGRVAAEAAGPLSGFAISPPILGESRIEPSVAGVPSGPLPQHWGSGYPPKVGTGRGPASPTRPVSIASTVRTFQAELAHPPGPSNADAAPLPMLPFEVQCLRMGLLAIVALPVEPLCAVGLAIQQLGPFKVAEEVATIWCAGYANGCYGYLPPESSYAYGGYEVERAHLYYGQPAAFAPDTAARTVAAAADGLAAIFDPVERR